ncbi:hypothetical protein [Tenacibaculum maritimum]|uniref:hypothetical protein n=1 Tax=Tenacibaculum maritimum TaxID=107401 RepID=UPI001E3EF8BA|nr:hypothetical protein [Tenacibaculum maritimum]MCD9585865.1 hypothetical protein [Tenacibaculum maritimum]MCD9612020.1 hypothetical protein [Tenacibaculum maritimum]MCD9621999.1 hypothetical protein [Tenacibaculum maritimum]MCD9628500.1 hypothetical protein [Tenacibaculum maritimum]MCD9631401.1 hypothetical protein [Tenacibaculum maritimum]
MSKKVYTGVHLLCYDKKSKQFGSIDASYNKIKETDKVRISLRKQDLVNVGDEDGFFSFEIDIEKLESIANVARSVYERIELLKTLDKRGKLKEDAYYVDN